MKGGSGATFADGPTQKTNRAKGVTATAVQIESIDIDIKGLPSWTGITLFVCCQNFQPGRTHCSF
jgi:hypothetical protein